MKSNIYNHLRTISLGTLLFIANFLSGQISFLAPNDIYVGGQPIASVAVDFDFNNTLDIASANKDLNNVSVLLNDGSGGFTTFGTNNVSTSPYSIVKADFNEDGITDLATSCLSASDKISVLLGLGSGNFSSAIQYTVSGLAWSITTNDFDGDGHSDIIVAADGLFVMLGDGNGAFDSTYVISSPQSSYIVSHDFNKDGNMDIATIQSFSNNIYVYIGDGNGGFAAGVSFSAGGSAPTSIVSDDFNGDTNLDLAIANQSSDKVAVLLGNGIGGFSTATSYTVGDGPMVIVSSDLNNDNIIDIAVTNVHSNNISILVGNGNGTFGTTTNITVGSMPRHIIAEDFNLDGKNDLAVSNFADGTISILINNYTPPAPPICLVTVDSTFTHNVVIWEQTNIDTSLVDSVIIYREITTNNYQRIGAKSANAISLFDDFDANPESTGYRYKLKTKNSLGQESLFSEYHNSIYLANNGSNFYWTPYQIENNSTPISVYNIYRDDLSTGNFQIIGSTTGNQLGYTDVNYSSFPFASYYVDASMSQGACEPSRIAFSGSQSNVKHMGTTNRFEHTLNDKIKIYPNPADKNITISGLPENSTISIYNHLGSIVLKNIKEKTDITALPQGVYSIHIETDKGLVVKKLVVQ